jgi:hypothetical protein
MECAAITQRNWPFHEWISAVIGLRRWSVCLGSLFILYIARTGHGVKPYFCPDFRFERSF